MERSVIVAAKRSPIGKYLGGFSRLAAPELGARVAKEILGEVNALEAGVDEVFVGCVLQAGLGQNPARQVALKAGIGDHVTAVTLNKVCGSGLEAVMQADRAIRCGDVNVALAGGIESMSLAPYYVPGARTGIKFGDGKLIDGIRDSRRRSRPSYRLREEPAGRTARAARPWRHRGRRRRSKSLSCT